MDKVNKSIKSGDIGSTAEIALVPLVFDRKTLVLYTAKRLNKESEEKYRTDQKMDIIEYLTDIKTFHDVTSLLEANPDYTEPMPNSIGQLIWSFDPYVKFFETREQRQSKVDKIIASLEKENVHDGEIGIRSVPSWGRKGNILYGRWDGILSVSNYFGHTGGVTTEISATYPTEILKMYNTWITEAVGEDVGTITRRMTNSSGTSVWNASSIYNRASMWLPSLTNTQETT